MKDWKRDLFMLWICQFFFQGSFSFGIPFAPFLMQELGVSPDALPFWVGLFGSAPALTGLLFAPFWGWMADRFGRKKMLLRCYIGGSIVLAGIAFCSTPQTMILLRLLQGIVCGSVPAALAMAASFAPASRTGLSLGVVNSADFSGLLIGSVLGGITSDAFGYRNALLISGLPPLLAAVLMILFLKENFVRHETPDHGESLIHTCLVKIIPHGMTFRFIAPILLLMGMVMFARRFDNSFVPLFVQELLGDSRNPATWTGIILSLAGIAGILSGLIAGYLSDRFSPCISA